MSALLLPAALLGALVISAVGGPRVIRAAAPALMRMPRAAALILIAALGIWLLAFASLALLVAWIISGPRLFPGRAGEVCQRCLAAASPLGAFGTVDTVIPAALLVALPAIATLAAVVLGVRRVRRTIVRTRTLAARIRAEARHRTVQGYRVLVIPDAAPQVFSLPPRLGGTVVSVGLLRALAADQLHAVLAHEQEHLRGRHHLLQSMLEFLAAPVRWLPLARAIEDAVPHYLEIAADDAARRRTGTRALAAALLLLGQPTMASSGQLRLLHAAGPDRIGHLVRPPRLGAAVLPSAALGALLLAFSAAVVAVHGPYLGAILSGCHLPTT